MAFASERASDEQPAAAAMGSDNSSDELVRVQLGHRAALWVNAPEVQSGEDGEAWFMLTDANYAWPAEEEQEAATVTGEQWCAAAGLQPGEWRAAIALAQPHAGGLPGQPLSQVCQCSEEQWRVGSCNAAQWARTACLCC